MRSMKTVSPGPGSPPQDHRTCQAGRPPPRCARGALDRSYVDNGGGGCFQEEGTSKLCLADPPRILACPWIRLRWVTSLRAPCARAARGRVPSPVSGSPHLGLRRPSGTKPADLTERRLIGDRVLCLVGSVVTQAGHCQNRTSLPSLGLVTTEGQK